MSVREYIGARYVPLFIGDWDDTKTYEPLSIVQYQGNSYTSRQFVPVGTAIDNDAFWAETGNYNAQVEQYREEVQALGDDLQELEEKVDAGVSDAIQASRAFNVSQLPKGALKQVGSLGSSEYTYQSSYYDGTYIYSARYTSGNPVQIRKYSVVETDEGWTLSNIGQSTLPAETHCNSMCFDERYGGIIISGNKTNLTYIINPDDLTITHIATNKAYALNSFVVNGNNALGAIQGSNACCPYLYDSGLDAYIIQGVTRRAMLGRSGRQGMCKWRTGFARLVSNPRTTDTSKNSVANGILLYNMNGNEYRSLMFGENVMENEGEGISFDLENNRFIITDSNGFIYTLSLESIGSSTAMIDDNAFNADIIPQALTRNYNAYGITTHVELASGRYIIRRPLVNRLQWGNGNYVGMVPGAAQTGIVGTGDTGTSATMFGTYITATAKYEYVLTYNLSGSHLELNTFRVNVTPYSTGVTTTGYAQNLASMSDEDFASAINGAFTAAGTTASQGMASSSLGLGIYATDRLVYNVYDSSSEYEAINFVKFIEQ